MGSFTFFVDEEIEIHDWNGLVAYIDRYYEMNPAYWIEKDQILKTDDDGKKRFTFEEFTEMKLVSYWYDDDVVFFNGLARYISGKVNWEFESDDYMGYITFEEGKCYIITGDVIWKTQKALEMMHDKEDKRLKNFLVMEAL